MEFLRFFHALRRGKEKRLYIPNAFVVASSDMQPATKHTAALFTCAAFNAKRFPFYFTFADAGFLCADRRRGTLFASFALLQPTRHLFIKKEEERTGCRPLLRGVLQRCVRACAQRRWQCARMRAPKLLRGGACGDFETEEKLHAPLVPIIRKR